MSHTTSPEPEIHERAAQPYLGIPREVTSGVPDAVDAAFPALFAWLGEHGAELSGPPFIRFHEVDGDGAPLALEVAVPVAAELPGDDLVRAGTLPAGRYVTLVHAGPYRSTTVPDLAATRERLHAWIAARGIVYGHETDRGMALPCCVEHLQVSPGTEPDFTKWRTELAYLIVDR